MELPILLTITTPDETRTVRCDAVSFTVPDSADHPNAGGSVGIRQGHTDALMAVAAGQIVARAAGDTVLTAVVSNGFAVVRRDAVTVITDRITDPQA